MVPGSDSTLDSMVTSTEKKNTVQPYNIVQLKCCDCSDRRLTKEKHKKADSEAQTV